MSEWYKVEGMDGQSLGRLKLEDGKIVGEGLDPGVSKFLKFVEEHREGRALEYFSVQSEVDPYTIGTGVRQVGPEHEDYLTLLGDELQLSVKAFGQFTKE